MEQKTVTKYNANFRCIYRTKTAAKFIENLRYINRTKSILNKTIKTASKYIENFRNISYKLYQKASSNFTQFRDLGAIIPSL